jgi:PAS domain S-box-containing protein
MKLKTTEELTKELSELNLDYDKLKKTLEQLHIEARLEEDMILKLLKAVNTISDAIFLTDTEGIITYINSGFTALYGFSDNEVVGKVTPRIIKSGLLDKEVYEDFWKTLKSKNEVKGEILNKRKNGEVIFIDGTSSPILDEQNNIIGFLGIQRDITQRKREEEKLKNKMAEIQRLMDSMLKRDLKMIELKKEVNELLRKSGQAERYKIVG